VTIDRQIDDLASVITGLAAGPCVLAGHSWGGILVQLLAFRRPDLAAGLVLVDPGHDEMESLLPLPLQWEDSLAQTLRCAQRHARRVPRRNSLTAADRSRLHELTLADGTRPELANIDFTSVRLWSTLAG
jgi:pimeloyl-ACP methyl ester carboxylesterase